MTARLIAILCVSLFLTPDLRLLGQSHPGIAVPRQPQVIPSSQSAPASQSIPVNTVNCSAVQQPSITHYYDSSTYRHSMRFTIPHARFAAPRPITPRDSSPSSTTGNTVFAERPGFAKHSSEHG